MLLGLLEFPRNRWKPLLGCGMFWAQVLHSCSLQHEPEVSVLAVELVGIQQNKTTLIWYCHFINVLCCYSISRRKWTLVNSGGYSAPNLLCAGFLYTSQSRHWTTGLAGSAGSLFREITIFIILENGAGAVWRILTWQLLWDVLLHPSQMWLACRTLRCFSVPIGVETTVYGWLSWQS